jgi:hypothetical protein
MKTLLALGLCAAASIASYNACAIPVQYQFSGSHTGEGSPDPVTGAMTPTPTSDYLLANGTPISGAFFYDADTVRLYGDVPPGIIFPAQYGTISVYRDAISVFSLAFGEHSYTSLIGHTTIIGDSNTASGFDLVTHGGYLLDANINVNGSALESWQLSYSSPLDYNTLSNQNLLPQPLPGVTPLQLSLLFTNGNGITGYRLVEFGNLQITEVPLPTSAALFGGALFSLWRPKRRTK